MALASKTAPWRHDARGRILGTARVWLEGRVWRARLISYGVVHGRRLAFSGRRGRPFARERERGRETSSLRSHRQTASNLRDGGVLRAGEGNSAGKIQAGEEKAIEYSKTLARNEQANITASTKIQMGLAGGRYGL